MKNEKRQENYCFSEGKVEDFIISNHPDLRRSIEDALKEYHEDGGTGIDEIIEGLKTTGGVGKQSKENISGGEQNVSGREKRSIPRRLNGEAGNVD